MMRNLLIRNSPLFCVFAVFALFHSVTTTDDTNKPEIAPSLAILFGRVRMMENKSSTAAPELSTSPSMNKSSPVSQTVKSKPKRLKYHRQIFLQCLKIPNYRLREDCKNMARNPLIFAMQNMTRAYANIDDEKEYVKELRQRQFRDCKPNCDGRKLLNVRSLPVRGFQDCKVKCPSVAEWLGSKTDNIRSTSPWKYCRHYDPDRIPQWINEAICLCTGCIDPRTGKEDRNYISSPLKTSLRVLRKTAIIKSFSACNNKLCTNSFEEFTIGCHCLVPSIRS